MIKEKIYFPNLNGLRFIAAFLVIAHHIEQAKFRFGYESYWSSSPFIGITGKLGVILFFVLSGFLITYLLLAEERAFKTISVRKFYVRRILRIWPLYFLIVILALFVLPHLEIFTVPGFPKEIVHANLITKIILYVVFLPNLVFSLFGSIPYATHTWSIGTEEQFYLAWPVLFKYFRRNRIILMLCVIGAYLALGVTLKTRYLDFLSFKPAVHAFWYTFNIDCMAIGGIFSILLFQQSQLLRILMNEYFFYATLIMTSLFIAFGVHIPLIHYEFYAVLFGVIILNFSSNTSIRISLENKILKYLGNISYGIYMYHPIGIGLALYIAVQLDLLTNWLIYPLTVIVTILLAVLSYHYYESFFMKFKHRFSRISSGSHGTEKNIL